MKPGCSVGGQAKIPFFSIKQQGLRTQQHLGDEGASSQRRSLDEVQRNPDSHIKTRIPQAASRLRSISQFCFVLVLCAAWERFVGPALKRCVILTNGAISVLAGDLSELRTNRH